MKTLRSIKFNEDCSCFTCCGELGALVFNVSPLAYLGRLDGDQFGSLSQACLLNRSNIFAVVGGGKAPKFAENTVIIWDDKLKHYMLEYVFPSPIIDVSCGKQFLAVSLESSVEVFDFPSNFESRIASLPTWRSWQSLIDIRWPIIATTCHIRAGNLQIIRIATAQQQQDQKPIAAELQVAAHFSQLAAIRLSPDAQLVATGSQRGTIIRIFCTSTAQLMLQLRRGSDLAQPHSIAWSPDCHIVCAISDKATLHFWSVSNCRRDRDFHRAQSTSAWPAFDEAKRSFASFSLTLATRFVLAFAGARSVAAIGRNGEFHRIQCCSSAVARDAFDIFTDLPALSQF